MTFPSPGKLPNPRVKPTSPALARMYLVKNTETPMGFPSGSVVKNPLANTGDTGDAGLSPQLGRSPGGKNGNLLHYFCQVNPMDTGACWQATGHRGCKELDMTEHTYTREIPDLWFMLFYIILLFSGNY